MDDPRLYSWPDLPLAVVIGAGGMGLAVAKRLGQHARLLIADLDAERLESVKNDLEAGGYWIQTAPVDVTDQASVTSFASTVEQMGGFDSLAHVAGLSPSMANWQTVMSVNLRGPALMAEKLLPHANRGSAAVFISSLAGHMATFNPEVGEILADPLADDLIEQLDRALGAEMNSTLSYLLSKKALINLCQRLAASWGREAARINSVSPGLIATPMGALEFENQPSKFDLLEKTPIKRQGNVHEICDAVEFLLSPKASFISGTDLLVDGGINAALKFAQ